MSVAALSAQAPITANPRQEAAISSAVHATGHFQSSASALDQLGNTDPVSKLIAAYARPRSDRSEVSRRVEVLKGADATALHQKALEPLAARVKHMQTVLGAPLTSVYSPDYGTRFASVRSNRLSQNGSVFAGNERVRDEMGVVVYDGTNPIGSFPTHDRNKEDITFVHVLGPNHVLYIDSPVGTSHVFVRQVQPDRITAQYDFEVPTSYPSMGIRAVVDPKTNCLFLAHFTRAEWVKGQHLPAFRYTIEALSLPDLKPTMGNTPEVDCWYSGLFIVQDTLIAVGTSIDLYQITQQPEGVTLTSCGSQTFDVPLDLFSLAPTADGFVARIDDHPHQENSVAVRLVGAPAPAPAPSVAAANPFDLSAHFGAGAARPSAPPSGAARQKQ